MHAIVMVHKMQRMALITSRSREEPDQRAEEEVKKAAVAAAAAAATTATTAAQDDVVVDHDDRDDDDNEGLQSTKAKKIVFPPPFIHPNTFCVYIISSLISLLSPLSIV